MLTELGKETLGIDFSKLEKYLKMLKLEPPSGFTAGFKNALEVCFGV